MHLWHSEKKLCELHLTAQIFDKFHCLSQRQCTDIFHIVWRFWNKPGIYCVCESPEMNSMTSPTLGQNGESLKLSDTVELKKKKKILLILNIYPNPYSSTWSGTKWVLVSRFGTILAYFLRRKLPYRIQMHA